MAELDCSVATSNLWNYNIDLDSLMFPLEFLRPLVFVGCSADQDSHFFPVYCVRFDRSSDYAKDFVKQAVEERKEEEGGEEEREREKGRGKGERRGGNVAVGLEVRPSKP